MKKVFYLIAFISIVFESCTKTDDTSRPNEKQIYSFEIGADRETDEDGTDKTRVEIIDGAHHWSVGDKVGMFIYQNYPSQLRRINNLAMTGQHTEPATSTSFVGELSQSDIAMFQTSSSYKYIYITYFPYNANVSSLGIFELRFPVPQTMTIRKNEFPSDYAFMYARADDFPAMTWLDGDGKQQYGERVGFSYKHVYSYLRVRLDINLMGLPVTKIEITHPSANISGDMIFHSYYDTVSGGSNRNVVVNLEQGMNLGDEVYIPMILASYPSGTKFTFTFSNGVTYEKTISSNLTLQRGKVHNIAFKLPFIADFEKYPGLTTSSFPYTGGSLDYLGHTYRGYTVGINPIYIGFGDSMMAGALESPTFNLSGKTSIPVELKARFYGRPAGVLGDPCYAYIDAINENLYYLTDYNYTYLQKNVNLAFNVIREYSIQGINLTPSTSKISIVSSSAARIYSLEVHPL